MSRNPFESYEDYDESYDDESYDDEAYEFGESSFPPTRTVQVPRFAQNLMRPVPTPPYRGIAQLNTPAGPANVALPSDLVSKKEFKALEAKVLANNRAILGTGKAIGALNLNAKKSEMAMKKKFAAIQQGQMFSALLPPKLNEVTVSDVLDKKRDPKTGALAKDDIVTVASTKFDLMTTLLPMIVSGGMGGSSDSGDSSSNMNMMLPLILILNQNNSNNTNNSNNNSNDNTMLAVAMMMMATMK